MNEFTGKMIIGDWSDVELRTNKLWVITSALTWIRPNGDILKLTPYLITDYATIPKSFWWLLPKRSVYYDIAAAFHDDCVMHRNVRSMTLMDCHEVFKEIMKHYKTPKWKYELMYYAVVAAGPFLRSKGDGTYRYKLTEKELMHYEQIKQTYPWAEQNLALSYMRQRDPTEAFCF